MKPKGNENKTCDMYMLEVCMGRADRGPGVGQARLACYRLGLAGLQAKLYQKFARKTR